MIVQIARRKGNYILCNEIIVPNAPNEGIYFLLQNWDETKNIRGIRCHVQFI